MKQYTLTGGVFELLKAEADTDDQQNKLIVIGLDGGCPELIEKWLSEGKLPNLKKLAEDGCRGVLKSTILPVTPVAWTSFSTGKNPGKHGVFDFMERKEGSYDLQPVLVGQSCDSLWEILTQAEKRVIVINVPMTYPPAKVKGIMISGLPALDVRKDFAYPSDILDEIEREVGEYRIHYKVEFTGENHEDFLRDVHFLIERRSQVARYLAENYSWDLLMVHFQATDWVQHFFWKYADPNHPDHNPFPSIARHAIRDVYMHIDKELGKIVRAWHENVNVIVISDHGFGPLYKVVYLNNYLDKMGLLHFKKGPRYLLHKLGMTSANFYKLLVKLGLGNAVPRFRHNKQRIINLFISFNDINWNRTKAYSFGHNGQIYINVRGREPKGCVKQGAEYEELRERIIRNLKALFDPDTGAPLFDSIHCKEELYSGVYLEKAPDIIALLTRYNQEANYYSNELLGEAPNNLSGYHRLDGFYLLSGPMFVASAHTGKANIIDMAPTILSLFGATLPADMDGQILEEFISEEWKIQSGFHPSVDTVKGRIEEKRKREKPRFTEEEEELIKKRLRKLGYI